MCDRTNEPTTSVPITDIFDLHPFAPQDVKAATEAYLEEAIKLNFSVVRIIHGRGIGLQREMVHALLRSNPNVAFFRDAPSGAGGWGATVASLQK